MKQSVEGVYDTLLSPWYFTMKKGVKHIYLKEKFLEYNESPGWSIEMVMPQNNSVVLETRLTIWKLMNQQWIQTFLKHASVLFYMTMWVWERLIEDGYRVVWQLFTVNFGSNLHNLLKNTKPVLVSLVTKQKGDVQYTVIWLWSILSLGRIY